MGKKWQEGTGKEEGQQREKKIHTHPGDGRGPRW
jgi:hypothetical protein